MLGAIIGDIAGSRFEFNNIHTKDFEFFHPDCQITDDSAMTIALMAAILEGDMQNEMSFKNGYRLLQEVLEALPSGRLWFGILGMAGIRRPSALS